MTIIVPFTEQLSEKWLIESSNIDTERGKT